MTTDEFRHRVMRDYILELEHSRRFWKRLAIVQAVLAVAQFALRCV